MTTADMERATWQAARDHAADCDAYGEPSSSRVWAGCPAGRALDGSLGRLWRQRIDALSGSA